MFPKLSTIIIFAVFGIFCFMGGVDCGVGFTSVDIAPNQLCQCDCGFGKTAYNSGWVKIEFPVEILDSKIAAIFGTITLFAYVKDGKINATGPVMLNLGPIEAAQ